MKYHIKAGRDKYLYTRKVGDIIEVKVGPQPDTPGRHPRWEWELEEVETDDPDPPGYAGSYLYSAEEEERGNTEFWLGASGYNRWGQAKRRRWLATQPEWIVVSCNTGLRPALQEEPFDALANQATRTHLREVLKDAISHGHKFGPTR